ncbi:hypothetical protein Taro_031737 [Colocasia esculenta]|uniref:Uncharacterized protein n=1 Tax=Colocasia esculenta TaxID=4460 RepID=A0A843VPM6_COLES|nr:hypothetical protein [Colocasia esculenta]
MSFTTIWGRVEELLVAGEKEIKHTKLIFFPFSFASACANHPLGVDRSVATLLGDANILKASEDPDAIKVLTHQRLAWVFALAWESSPL